MKRAFKAFGAATVAAAVFVTGTAHAAVLGTQTVQTGFRPAALNGSLSVDEFSGSGVTSIDLVFTGILKAEITVKNNNPGATNVEAQIFNDWFSVLLPEQPFFSIDYSLN